MLEDAADLSIHSRRIERFLGARKASREAFERLLDPSTEPVVHRLLFAAPVGGAAQDHGLVGLGMARELDLDAFAHRPPAVATGKFGAELLQLRLRRADDVAPASGQTLYGADPATLGA